MQTNIGCDKEFAGIRPPGMTIKIDKTLTKPGYAADAAATGLVVKQAKEAIGHYPIIGNNGNWWVWNATYNQYEDSGSVATLMTLVVNSLPESGKPGVIYLVPYGEGENRFKEYIWLDDSELEHPCDHQCSHCPHHCPCPCPYPATGRFEPLGYEQDLSIYAEISWVEENFLLKDDEKVFIAKYDETELEEIAEANEADKLIACVVDNKTFTLSDLDENGATFAATFLRFEEGEPHIYSRILYINSENIWSSSADIELASAITLEEIRQDLTQAQEDIHQLQQQMVDITELKQKVETLEGRVDVLEPNVEQLNEWKADVVQPLVDYFNPTYEQNPETEEYYVTSVDIDIIDGNGW